MTSEATSTCPSCGAADVGTRFCESCGAEQQSVAPTPTAVFAVAPPIPQPSVAPAQQAPPIYVPQPVYVAAPYYGRRTNGFAVASLIFGLLGGSVFAIIFGHVALGQIRRTGEGGSGMATVGLVFGYLWLIGVIIYVIVVAVAVSQL